MITQFSGETRREAIVNHFSLDLEDEDDFFQYMEDMGYSEESEDDVLESLHKMYLKKKDGIEI